MPVSRLFPVTADLQALQMHAAAPGPEGLRVHAGFLGIDDTHEPGWWLHYTIEGPVEALAVPAPQPAGPADGLWRHTCLEAFVQDGDGPGYREFNFSPSGQWAVYRLAAERERCVPDAPPAIGPVITSERGAHALRLRVWVPRGLLPDVPGRVGLTAVIETREGLLSYWALRHPHADRPDFHHPAGRTIAPAWTHVSSPSA